MAKIEKYTLTQTKVLIVEVNYDCDPKPLMKALNILIEQYEALDQISQPTKKVKLKRIRDDKSSINEFYDKKIFELLSIFAFVESSAHSIISSGLTKQETDISNMIIHRLIKLCEDKKKQHSNLITENELYALGDKFILHKNALLCGILARIYEEHFQRKFGYSRSSMDAKPSGPALRFVQAVSEKIGAEMTKEAIIKAHKRMKK